MTFFEFIIGVKAYKGMWLEKLRCFIMIQVCVEKINIGIGAVTRNIRYLCQAYLLYYEC